MSIEQTLATPEAQVEELEREVRGPHKGRAPKRKRASLRTKVEATILVGPGLIVFLAFVIFPVIMAAYYGFFRWNGYGPPTEFVGLDNYINILRDPVFIDALKNNGFIVVMALVMQGPIALVLALLMNREMKGQSLIRMLIFVPYVISEVIVGTGWSLMLSTEGAINSLLKSMGVTNPPNWLDDPKVAIWVLLLIITWKYVGFATILLLAGLQGIPSELFEAAAIDGASFWQIQRSITIPLLGPTIRIWAFLSIIGSLQLFDLVYVIWGNYLSQVAGTMTMAGYMNAFGRSAGAYGFGNAVAVLLFIITLIVALIYQNFVLKRDTDGALTGPKTKKRKWGRK